MLHNYAVLGTGDTSKGIIEDSLRELSSGGAFIVTATAKLSASEKRVLDWVSDNEVPYVLIHNQEAQDKYVDHADVVYEFAEEEFVTKALKLLAKSSGTLLLLWDENRNREMEDICLQAADMGIKILDLTNGLVPITVEAEDKPEPVHVAPAEEVEVEPFSREEMLSMSIGVLRKSAKAQGVTVTPNMTKVQIVDAILSTPEVAEEEEEILPPIDLGTFKIVSTRATVSTSESETCMLTVVFPNGIIMSRPANVSEAKQLFGFEPTTL
jgi:hypothetical protein